ncbi:MAG TPA: NAD(P)H-hydrate epimerase [Nocardioides sp.]|uniref:NAD(P)H-hydrate epimerase n=1 Tax=Nocardioides sp. TaxID=35761 RepID=UPI002E32DEA7|nr:NAD(P)H-hydrate epimerase [Nocardioides sp.]HEX3932254.1 NAD(P)H-hydrate epimerase [Nocardioides sp.]
MRSAHTVAQVRAAEEALAATLPAGALMLRAAAGLASSVTDLMAGAYGRRVLLLVGSGDNGGDAMYAAAMLARRGARVEVLAVADTVHEAGLAQLLGVGGRRVTLGEISTPDVVVDGIVGIGGRPGLRERAAEAVRAVAGVPMVAVDVPSGVDVDTGRVSGDHVSADLTVAFGTHKVAHLVEPAASSSGVVHLVDLGLELPAAAVTALQQDDIASLLPRPTADAQKYTRGVVGVRAGSRRYPGAGVLSTAGAACGLAGMVRYAGGAPEAVLAAHPEVVVGEGRVQAWVVGSGGDADAASWLRAALGDGVPLVVDADALRHLTRPLERPAILTPHAGELAAMLEVDRAEVEADQLRFARLAAGEYAATVVLKGHHTLVADPDGRVRVTTSGTPWLAVAGAGDVLGGLCGALLAAGLEPADAAAAGAWLHGAAATYASRGGPLSAPRVAAAIPGVVAELLS